MFMIALKKPVLVLRTPHQAGSLKDNDLHLIVDTISDALGCQYTYGHKGVDLYSAALTAEWWCEANGLRVKDRNGMYIVDTSGSTSYAYQERSNYKRIVTVAKIVRKSSGWYLVEVGTDKIRYNQFGKTIYYLTREQDIKVRQHFSKQYIVNPLTHSDRRLVNPKVKEIMS